MITTETLKALTEGPLSEHGAGCAKRWERFIKLTELALLQRLFTDDLEQRKVIAQRERRLAAYGSMDFKPVAEQLAENLLVSLKDYGSQEVLDYWWRQFVPWLNKLRADTYTSILVDVAKAANDRHRARMADYQTRRRQALRDGLRPNTPEWRERFPSARVKKEPVPHDPAGSKRWHQRRRQFLESDDAKNPELAKAWNTLWSIVEETGFRLP